MLFYSVAVIDAGVISPVGVLSQTAVHFGDFDACLGLKGAFDTQFCFVDILPFAENDSHVSDYKTFLYLLINLGIFYGDQGAHMRGRGHGFLPNVSFFYVIIVQSFTLC